MHGKHLGPCALRPHRCLISIVNSLSIYRGVQVNSYSKHAYIGIQPWIAFLPKALQGPQKKGAGLCMGNTLRLVLYDPMVA